MICFDHAAAAPVLPAVRNALPGLIRQYGGNQEAAHGDAFALRQTLKAAEARLLEAWFAPRRVPAEARVVWGSSGSDLARQIGELALPSGGSVAFGELEHPAVAAALHRLAHSGRSRQTLAIPAERTPLAPDTRLAETFWVQSETGMVAPVAPLIAAWRRAAPDALLFVDAVQGAFKLPCPAERPDLVLLSGHKFGAPGGAALLLLTPAAVRLYPQFEALRHPSYLAGRVEPWQVLALTMAAELAAAQRPKEQTRIAALQQELREILASRPLPDGKRIRFTVPVNQASPYILHFLLPGYQSGVVVRMLSEAGFAVAAGSACAAESKEPSAVLRALGFSREEAYSGLRISFGRDTTRKAVRALAEALFQRLKSY